MNTEPQNQPPQPCVIENRDDPNNCDYIALRNHAFSCYTGALLAKHGLSLVNHKKRDFGAYFEFANFETEVTAVYQADYVSQKLTFRTSSENAQELSEIYQDFSFGGIFSSTSRNRFGSTRLEFRAVYQLPWERIQNVTLSNLQGQTRAELIWRLKYWHPRAEDPKPWWLDIQTDPNRRRPIVLSNS